MSIQQVIRWLWDYLPKSQYRCNPLSVPSNQAIKIIAEYAWSHPGSNLAIWYNSAPASVQTAFKQAWTQHCNSLR